MHHPSGAGVSRPLPSWLALGPPGLGAVAGSAARTRRCSSRVRRGRAGWRASRRAWASRRADLGSGATRRRRRIRWYQLSVSASTGHRGLRWRCRDLPGWWVPTSCRCSVHGSIMARYERPLRTTWARPLTCKMQLVVLRNLTEQWKSQPHSEMRYCCRWSCAWCAGGFGRRHPRRR